MATSAQQRASAQLWALAERQHGVLARGQLIALGIGPQAIKHRVARGRLHPVVRGVYAVGRPQLTRHGRWMAAVLTCGSSALLSHESAAALWRLRSGGESPIEVSVTSGRSRSRAGLTVHRRANLGPSDRAVVDQIPVTNVVCTLVDLAPRLARGQIEAATNRADKLELATPERLRADLDGLPRRPGVAILRSILDRHALTLTQSELERSLLPIVRAAGLPTPCAGVKLNGFEVDFFWPELGLVVETDGLRYHRTAAQQATDRLRDQIHTAAGLTTLRFTHAQVRFEASRVRAVLARTAAALSARPALPRSG